MPSLRPRAGARRWSYRLLDSVDASGLRRLQFLRLSGRPSDDGTIDFRLPAEAEMQPPLILRAETGAAGDFLELLPSVPEELRPARRSRFGCCTAAPRRPHGIRPPGRRRSTGDPATPDSCRATEGLAGSPPRRPGRHGRRNRRGRPSDRRDDRSHPPSAQRRRTPGSVVDPDLLRLMPGQAPVAHRRPVRRVADDDLMSARDLGVVVPVALVARRRIRSR